MDGLRVSVLEHAREPGAWRSVVAVLAGAGVAWGGLSYVALTIGVLAEGYHYTPKQAAGLATLELAAMAVVAISAGYALRSISVRRLAVVGAVLAGAANICTAVTTDPVVIAVLRLAAGAGFGAMAAGLNTSISRAAHAESLFMRANFGCITAAAVFFAVMPEIYGRAGFPSYFVAYGVLCLVAGALLGWLPCAESAAAGRPSESRADGWRRIAMFLAVSLLWLCYAAVWSLTERLGRDIGMTEEAVGRAMGLGTLSGLAGAGVAAWLAGRLKPLFPLIFTTFTTGVCYVWFCYCYSASSYTWVLCIWGVVFCPILAYAYAVGTELDNSGALGRLIGGGTAISTALGPIAGAQVKDLLGYHGVGVVMFIGTAMACVAILVISPRGRPTFAVMGD